jgi:8-oxo-dGTP pyrophosphatase MutT (NUDIX family)
MDMNYETITTPPVDAASVLLLRDSEEGLQVLLMRRAQASQVLGGAYVFPGGKVDAQDHAQPVLSCLSETPARLQERLHEPDLEPSRAAGLFMAALREAFEECGVLAAQDQQGPSLAAQLRASASPGGWHQSLISGGLCLNTEALLPWSRWITPRQPAVTNKRFDTRFFLARVCDDQIARHDDFETTDSVWLTPRQALARYAAAEIDLVAPQIMSLYELKAHQTVQQALDEAKQRPPALIEPHPFDEEGQRILCYPGDVSHPVQSRAMRGPTRLLFAKGRFIPLGGMDQLLD